MSNILKAACIGLRHGHASGLIGTFRQLDGVQVVAYCEDTDAGALERVGTAHPDARRYTSVDELLARDGRTIGRIEVTAVHEAPPAPRRAAPARKPVLSLEKYLASRPRARASRPAAWCSTTLPGNSRTRPA